MNSDTKVIYFVYPFILPDEKSYLTFAFAFTNKQSTNKKSVEIHAFSILFYSGF